MDSSNTLHLVRAKNDDFVSRGQVAVLIVIAYAIVLEDKPGPEVRVQLLISWEPA